MTEFFDAIRSPVTRDRYEKRLDLFFRHIGVGGGTIEERARTFARKAKADNQWATAVINDYMRHQKERSQKKEIAEATIPNYFKPIKLFCEMNDILLDWKKISRRIPKGRGYGQDRNSTVEEIKQVLTYPDRRVKPAVLLMLSSGIRIGSFDYLNWGHLEKVVRDGRLLAARITVYAGTPDEYSSFVTPGCYGAVEEYIEYRKRQGERIIADSPVLRDLFHPDKLGRGSRTSPRG